MDKLVTQVEAYFDKKLQVFDLPLQFTCSDFQQEVYERLKEIPYGNTCAYAELARRLGNPKAVRAVARANAENKFAIIIPCHRVLGANGDLTGYSGGLERKRYLLSHEGVWHASQMSLF